MLYHRWSCFAAVSALLARQAWLPFGHWTIYPNQYIILIGTPGARKSTAISIASKALKRIGYDYFGPDRSSKERFLVEMIGGFETDEEDLLEMTLESLTSEIFVNADEFVDFIGKNNAEFLTLFGKLWDCPDEYRQPKLHGKSVVVPAPTVNTLCGTTPDAFHKNMPPESIGQGAMSRFIFVHGEPTGIKITEPKEPSAAVQQAFSARLKNIQHKVRGKFTLSPDSLPLRERLYKEYPDIEDYRFKYYNTRRFTHLLKLACIMAACRLSMTVVPEDLLAANTLLHYTEIKMPNGLGEFGKARNADVANAVIEIIKTVKRPVTIKYLWKHVAQDLNRQEELQEVIRNLTSAGKLKTVTDPMTKVIGYTTNFEKAKSWPEELLLPNFLKTEERL